MSLYTDAKKEVDNYLDLGLRFMCFAFLCLMLACAICTFNRLDVTKKADKTRLVVIK